MADLGFAVMNDLGFDSSPSTPRNDQILQRKAESATRLGIKKEMIKYDYRFGNEIGRGSYGSVRLCRNRSNGVDFACKTISKKCRETPMEVEASVHGEIEIMQHLQGYPGVVNLGEVYEDEDSFHLVMELVSGGNLCDKFLKVWPCSELTSARWMRQIMATLKFCHDNGVIHRDVKLDNVLLTSSGSLKLADFGLAARFSEGQKLSGAVGTPDYVAPEVLQGSYTEKADIWSAGIILHVLLVGYFPFKGHDFPKAIMSKKLNFDSGRWKLVSSSARDLISRMLTRDVDKRLSAEEVLNHPWISEVKRSRVCAPSNTMWSSNANASLCPAY